MDMGKMSNTINPFAESENKSKDLLMSQASSKIKKYMETESSEKARGKVDVKITENPTDRLSAQDSSRRDPDKGKTEETVTTVDNVMTATKVRGMKDIWERTIKMLKGSRERKKMTERGRIKSKLLLDFNNTRSFFEELLQYHAGSPEMVARVSVIDEHAASESSKHADIQRSYRDLEKKYSTETEELRNRLQFQKDVITDYSNRLAAEMSKKLASDESSLENVSIKTRPMNVSEDYSLLLTNEWLAAKTMLDEGYPMASEQEKVAFLSHVMKRSKITAGKMHSEIIAHMSEQLGFLGDVAGFFRKWMESKCLQQPSKDGKKFQGHTQIGMKKDEGWKEYAKTMPVTPTKGLVGSYKPPLAVTNAVGDFLRTSVDTTDFTQFYKIVMDEIVQTWRKKRPATDDVSKSEIDPDDLRANFDFLKYVNAMSKVAWKMTIQRPQMMFDFTTERKGEKYQDLFWKSEVAPHSKVTVVYPILYHGNRMMAKGKIYLWKSLEITPL